MGSLSTAVQSSIGSLTNLDSNDRSFSVRSRPIRCCLESIHCLACVVALSYSYFQFPSPSPPGPLPSYQASSSRSYEPKFDDSSPCFPATASASMNNSLPRLQASRF